MRWIDASPKEYGIDLYQFMDGDRPRNMKEADFHEYLRILEEMKISPPHELTIKRYEWLPSEDEGVVIDGTVYLKGNRFYQALFINGVTDAALEIAIASAKNIVKQFIDSKYK